MLRYVVLCIAKLCRVVPCYAVLCHAMPCCAMLSYAMVCYSTLILWHVTLSESICSMGMRDTARMAIKQLNLTVRSLGFVAQCYLLSSEDVQHRANGQAGRSLTRMTHDPPDYKPNTCPTSRTICCA